MRLKIVGYFIAVFLNLQNDKKNKLKTKGNILKPYFVYKKPLLEKRTIFHLQIECKSYQVFS